MGAPDSDSVEEVGEAAGVRGCRERTGRVGGDTRARGVPGDDRERIGQARQLWKPAPRVTEESMEQDERGASSGTPVADCKALHVFESQLRDCHYGRPNASSSAARESNKGARRRRP